MTNEQLKEYKHKRGTIKGTLTRFSNFIASESEHKNELIKIKAKLDYVQTLLEKYDEVQTKIEILEADDPQTSAERIAFEENYYNAVTAAKTLIERLSKPGINLANSSNNNQDNNSNVKLPTLNLPTFSGAWGDWLFYHDTFNSLTHENIALSEIQKFHYLRASLKNEAAQVISALEVSAANYNVAWKLLRERFQNKRLIIHNHIKALFELAPITKESAANLRQLVDNVQKHLRALASLDQPTDQWDALIIYLICTKLDNTTKREWESSIIDNDSPSLTDITKFLNGRCQLLETLDLSKLSMKSSTSQENSSQSTKPQYNKHRGHFTSHVTTRGPTLECGFCKASHTIYKCDAFMKLPVKTRREEMQKREACINCLRQNHKSDECKAKSGCHVCKHKHNTLLHIDEQAISTNTPNTLVSHCSYKREELVLLPTAIVYVYDNNGGAQECRLLLDTGSQANFITDELCKRLKLRVIPFSLPITGINRSSTAVTHKTEVTIKSKYYNFNKSVTCYVLPQITENLPSISIDVRNLNIPNGMKLADPSFERPGNIDMLVGTELFFELLCLGQIKLGKNQPILQKTQLGWIVSGIAQSTVQSYHTSNQQCFLTINQRLENQLTRFWQLEDVKDASPYTEEELACENHYQTNVSREADGRFVVALPFRDNINQLGESRHLALKRLYNTERKLERQPSLKTEYANFMNEYERLGHMSVVKNENESPKHAYYLPHHAVLKPSSTTTKLRVVYDGSAKTTSGISLNDTLLVGPTIQDDLFSIIMRFRIYNYVLTADIAKMYRQVQVRESDRNFQRILWRCNQNEPVRCYQLNTVTYGTAAAPFLAIRCLQELARKNETEHPVASSILLRDFYVDDVITGGDTLENVKKLKLELQAVLTTGGFELRKFMSNHKSLRDINTKSIAGLADIQDGVDHKTLGLLWQPENDVLSYSVKESPPKEKITKRSILSATAKTFDPLGLISPITLNAKLILQRLWQLNLGWDESLPLDLHTKWSQCQRDRKLIETIQIPRHVICENPRRIEIHGFSDSSEAAYGACIYLKSVDHLGNQYVNLLCSKSRVAPLKTTTLPRLELAGALLLAQLTNKVVDSLHIQAQEIFYWCDSTVTLAWIAASPSRWKTFVANRVAEIQKLTVATNWHYVNTKDNPADILSRGATPNQLIENQLWWHGPSWLSFDSEFWPCPVTPELKDATPETRNILTTCITSIASDFNIFSKYSSLQELQRITAYILRFRDNCRKPKKERRIGYLSVLELKNALACLLKGAQTYEFSSEISCLENGQQISRKSKLLTLAPFLDEKGLVRVGGRLKHAQISFDQKHPIVLPSKHPITKLIIYNEHIDLLHAGSQAVLASLRTKFWPLSARNAIRSVLHKCIDCFKAKPKDTDYPMGNLPESRVTPTRPFLRCGVDYAGPFYIKEGNYRGRKTFKSYLCLFVCLSTKAVHLELVRDLTTNCFLNALKRFIARRGKCIEILSDNATNFCGANNDLKELAKFLSDETNKNKIVNSLSQDSISWHFIPPRSPHFGGLWEAAVKSAKYHLKRVVGDACLNYEDLYTILTQIEACMNSRPLIPMSSDPHDLAPLTPGHFILGDSLKAIPEQDLRDVPTTRLSRYQRHQQLLQHFWARWSKEYLGHLQQRVKAREQQPLQPGMMVVIKEENLPPLKWKMGRIVKVFPGSDGVVRVADVKVPNGIVKRAVRKLCVLPLDI